MATELLVDKAPDDRRVRRLDDAAWWRRRSAFSSEVDAVLDGRELHFSRTGVLRRGAIAEDATTGEVAARWTQRDGVLTTADAVLRLRRASRWKSRWSLSDARAELARFEPEGWTGSRLRIVLASDVPVDRLVLLFSAWLASSLANDDAAGATASTSAVAGG